MKLLSAALDLGTNPDTRNKTGFAFVILVWWQMVLEFLSKGIGESSTCMNCRNYATFQNIREMDFLGTPWTSMCHNNACILCDNCFTAIIHGIGFCSWGVLRLHCAHSPCHSTIMLDFTCFSTWNMKFLLATLSCISTLHPTCIYPMFQMRTPWTLTTMTKIESRQQQVQVDLSKHSGLAWNSSRQLLGWKFLLAMFWGA